MLPVVLLVPLSGLAGTRIANRACKYKKGLFISYEHIYIYVYPNQLEITLGERGRGCIVSKINAYYEG